MSTPDQAGPARPARLAGLALLGIAAIALVVGLITIFSSGDEPDPGASPPPGSSQPSAPETSSSVVPPAPPPSSSSESPSSPPPPPPSSGAAPPATGAAPPPPNPPAPTPGHTQSVRVYNNSNVKGLADRAASDFRGNGWNVVAVDNYPGGIISITTVYFRPGTDEDVEAHNLAKEFGLRVEPRFEGIKDAAPGIIVIVTREYNAKSK
jgi:LytR cell envelope-related transcriptional attenuator